MNELDEKIRKALKEESGGVFDDDDRGEQGFFEMIGDTFRGKLRRWVILVWVDMFLVTGFTVAMAIQFFHVQTTRAMIAYASLFLLGAMGVAMLKMWYFMLMNRNAVLREVKRMELQIAHLAGKMIG